MSELLLLFINSSSTQQGLYIAANPTLILYLPIYTDPDYTSTECIKIKTSDGVGYIKLVSPDSIKASPIRIMTANGIRALSK